MAYQLALAAPLGTFANAIAGYLSLPTGSELVSLQFHESLMPGGGDSCLASMARCAAQALRRLVSPKIDWPWRSSLLMMTASGSAPGGKAVSPQPPAKTSVSSSTGPSLEPRGGRSSETQVRLSPFLEEHVDTYLGWLNDPEYRRYHSRDVPPPRAELIERVRSGAFEPSQAGGLFLILAGDGQPVGWIRYFRPDKAFDAYELGINIPERKNRGGGVGRQAMRQMIDYLFRTYETVRIQARVLDDNPVALKMCRYVGFQEEGVMRAAFRLESTWVDVHILSLLKGEWNPLGT